MPPMQRIGIVGSISPVRTDRFSTMAQAQARAGVGRAPCSRLLSAGHCLLTTHPLHEMSQRIRRGISLVLLGPALLGLCAGCGGGGDDPDGSGASGNGGNGAGTGGAVGGTGGKDGTGGDNGSGGDAMSSCGSPGRSGATSCAASVNGECPAGQYCDSEMLTCSSGCTSDENCPADEECVREAGEAVGACSACASCGDGTCSPGETADSCAADCNDDEENAGLDECFEVCDSFGFFCDDVASDACASACVGANSRKRASFIDCANPVSCDTYACVSRLD